MDILLGIDQASLLLKGFMTCSKNTQSCIAVHTTIRYGLLPKHAGQIDLLKLIAFVTMLIDHINRIMMSDDPSLLAWLVGRTAFPLFAIVFALNLSSDTARSTRKLWLAAIACQLPFILAFRETGLAWYSLNILFSFAVAAQSLSWLKTNQYWKVALLWIVFALPLSPNSYGLFGVILMMLSWHLLYAKSTMAWQHALWWLGLLGMNDFSSLALLGTLMSFVIIYASHYARMPQFSPRFLSKSVFYGLYAGHLLVLACFV